MPADRPAAPFVDTSGRGKLTPPFHIRRGPPYHAVPCPSDAAKPTGPMPSCHALGSPTTRFGSLSYAGQPYDPAPYLPCAGCPTTWLCRPVSRAALRAVPRRSGAWQPYRPVPCLPCAGQPYAPVRLRVMPGNPTTGALASYAGQPYDRFRCLPTPGAALRPGSVPAHARGSRMTRSPPVRRRPALDANSSRLCTRAVFRLEPRPSGPCTWRDRRPPYTDVNRTLTIPAPTRTRIGPCDPGSPRLRFPSARARTPRIARTIRTGDLAADGYRKLNRQCPRVIPAPAYPQCDELADPVVNRTDRAIARRSRRGSPIPPSIALIAP